MQFVEILKQEADIIHHVGALRVAGQKRPLPGAHVLVKIMAQLRDFAAKPFQVSGRNVRPRHLLQVGQFPFEPCDFVFSRFSRHGFW